MLAVTVADPDAIAIIALVVAAAASLPAWLSYARSRHTAHSVGTPNGRGTLVELGEQTLDRVDALTLRLDHMDRRFNTLEVQGRSLQTWTLTHEDQDERRFAAAHDSIERLGRDLRDMPCLHPDDE